MELDKPQHKHIQCLTNCSPLLHLLGKAIIHHTLNFAPPCQNPALWFSHNPAEQRHPKVAPFSRLSPHTVPCTDLSTCFHSLLHLRTGSRTQNFVPNQFQPQQKQKYSLFWLLCCKASDVFQVSRRYTMGSMSKTMTSPGPQETRFLEQTI